MYTISTVRIYVYGVYICFAIAMIQWCQENCTYTSSVIVVATAIT